MMSSIYDAEFFAAHATGSLASARVVAPFLLDLLAPAGVTSVADLGCGPGLWLRAFRDLGIDDVLGIDGDHVDPSSLAIPRRCFQSHDLETPLDVPRRFDLALSVEVAEHLQPAAAGTFITSLVSLAPMILFSAAIPGQGGTHHVNEQWPEYWADLFGQRDYHVIDCRRALWNDERIEPHYRQNMLLCVAESQLANYPKLAYWSAQTPEQIMRLVHPGVFQRWIEWGMSQSNAYWDLALRHGHDNVK